MGRELVVWILEEVDMAIEVAPLPKTLIDYEGPKQGSMVNIAVIGGEGENMKKRGRREEGEGNREQKGSDPVKR